MENVDTPALFQTGDGWQYIPDTAGKDKATAEDRGATFDGHPESVIDGRGADCFAATLRNRPIDFQLTCERRGDRGGRCAVLIEKPM